MLDEKRESARGDGGGERQRVRTYVRAVKMQTCIHAFTFGVTRIGDTRGVRVRLVPHCLVRKLCSAQASTSRGHCGSRQSLRLRFRA